MKRFIRLKGPVIACAALVSCGGGMTAQDFSGMQPALSPSAFFTGHTQSWGVIETAGGSPDMLFHSDAVGHQDEHGTLYLTQKFTLGDGMENERDWRFVQVDEHHFQGTANDVSGVAEGEAYGNVFHWKYVLQLSPGNSLKDADVEQWMYLQDDGTVLNRGAITKAGILVAQITEHFRHLSGGKAS